MAEAGQEEPELGLNTSKDGASYLVAAHMVGMVGGSGRCRARHRLRFGACVEKGKKIREMYTHKKSAKCTHTKIREMYTQKMTTRKKSNFRNARKCL